MATRREPSQHGITTVYHHPQAQADILFIHGLGGAPGRTWKATSNGVFWPTDLLPASLGDNLPVNILTYGYNAEVFSWFWEKPKPTPSSGTGDDGHDNRTGPGKPKPKNPSADPIHQHAHTLIAQLTSHRQSQNTARLPLIWVAHSLGGVLAKRALLYSHEVLTARMAEYRSIFISTYAMIFLGTPHDGSDLATLGRWVRGGLGTVLPRWVFDSESVLLGTLVPGGEVLGEISDRFLEVYQRFEMHMVWENWKTDLGVTKALIVKRQSAAPQLPGVFRYGIEATHSGMCKFDSTSASGYGTLSTAMRKWVGDAPSTILVRWAHEDEDRRRMIQREGLERVAAEYRAAGLDPPEQLAFVQTDPLDPTRPILQSPTSTTTPLPRSNNPTPSNPSNDPPFIHPTTIRANDYTVGRTAELHQLHTLLTDPRRRAHGTAAVLIQCLTGGGKTHLAREYVFRYREHYKGGVFWVPAGSRRELETWFGWVAKGVGIDTSVPVQEKNGSSSSSDTKKSGSRSSTRDTPPLVHAVRRWLNTHPHWLLVLDDIHFDTPGLADFIPDDAPPNTSLLYTSTERAVKGDQRFLGNPSVLELGLLPASEAQQLFLEIAAPRRRPWSDTEKELVKELVELMGRLPLMVQFAAQHVADTGEPLAGFVRMYRRKPGARALVPYQMLRRGLEERGEHAALNLMCLLVFFGGMVPVEMVVFGLPGLDKATPIKTRDAALGTTTLNNTLKILKRTSLLDRADSSQPPSPASTSLTSSFERPAPTATTAGAAGTSAGTEYLDLLSMHNVTRAYFIDWLREKKQILFWLKNAITLWSRAYDEASRRMREDPVAVGVADDYRRFGVHGEKLLANWEMFAKRRREVGEVRGELERRLGEIRGCVERLAERDSQLDSSSQGKGTGRVQPASVFDRVSASSQTDSYDSQPSGLDSPLDGPEFPGLAMPEMEFGTGLHQQQHYHQQQPQQQPQRTLPYPDNQVMPTAPEFGGEDMENERDDDQDTMVLSTTGTQVHVGGTNADADEVGSVISRLTDHHNPHNTQQDVTSMVQDWQRNLPHHRVVQWQRHSQHKHRVRLRAGGWQGEHPKSGPWLGLTYDDTLGLSVQRDDETRPDLHERTQSEAELGLGRIKMASSVASSPRLGSVGSSTARGSSTAKGSWVGGLGAWSPWGSMRKKQSPVQSVPEGLSAGPQQQHAQTQTPDRLSPPQPQLQLQPQPPPNNIFPTPNPYPRSTNSSPGPNPRATATASPFPPPSFSGIPTDDLLPSRPSVSVSGQPGQPGQQQPATGGGPVVVRHWNTVVYHPHGTPISNTSGVDWSSSDWSGSPDPMSLSYPTFPSYQRYPPGDGPVPASFIRGNSVVGNAGNPPFQSYPVQQQQRQQGQPLSFDDARYYYPSTTTNTATAGPIPGQSPGPGPGPVPGSGSRSRSPIRAQRIPTANATRLKKRMPLSTSRPVVSYTMTEPDPRLEPVLSDGEGEMEEEMVGLGLRSELVAGAGAGLGLGLGSGYPYPYSQQQQHHLPQQQPQQQYPYPPPQHPQHSQYPQYQHPQQVLIPPAAGVGASFPPTTVGPAAVLPPAHGQGQGQARRSEGLFSWRRRGSVRIARGGRRGSGSASHENHDNDTGGSGQVRDTNQGNGIVPESDPLLLDPGLNMTAPSTPVVSSQSVPASPAGRSHRFSFPSPFGSASASASASTPTGRLRSGSGSQLGLRGNGGWEGEMEGVDQPQHQQQQQQAYHPSHGPYQQQQQQQQQHQQEPRRFSTSWPIPVQMDDNLRSLTPNLPPTGAVVEELDDAGPPGSLATARPAMTPQQPPQRVQNQRPAGTTGAGGEDMARSRSEPGQNTASGDLLLAVPRGINVPANGKGFLTGNGKGPVASSTSVFSSSSGSSPAGSGSGPASASSRRASAGHTVSHLATHQAAHAPDPLVSSRRPSSGRPSSDHPTSRRPSSSQTAPASVPPSIPQPDNGQKHHHHFHNPFYLSHHHHHEGNDTDPDPATDTTPTATATATATATKKRSGLWGGSWGRRSGSQSRSRDQSQSRNGSKNGSLNPSRSGSESRSGSKSRNGSKSNSRNGSPNRHRRGSKSESVGESVVRGTAGRLWKRFRRGSDAG